MIWQYNSTEIDQIPTEQAWIGFVYLIEHIPSGKRYIGKKNLYSTVSRLRTVTLKSGIKKRKKVKITSESDWRTYYGSSEELQKLVETDGESAFNRTILRFCLTKGELSYYEAKYQFDYDVLLYPSLWFNKWISVKIHGTHLKNLV